jgi:uncharacterized iron-regulated protein
MTLETACSCGNESRAHGDLSTMHDDDAIERPKSAKTRASMRARRLQTLPVHRGRGQPPPQACRGAFFLSALSALAALITGCPSARPPASAPSVSKPMPVAGGPWVSAHGADHALVGRIWLDGRFVDRAQLFDRMRSSRFVLLGEKHDNPDHHRLQRAALESLAEGGRAPAVVFEMLDADRQSAIDVACGAAPPADPDAFAQAIGWNDRGWPWPLYRPLVAFTLERRWPLVAGNYPHARIRALFAAGHGHGTVGAHTALAPDPAELAALGVDRPLPDDDARALEAELVAAHCGHPVGAMLPAFVTAQRLRDAKLAERMATTATAGGAVLVAGAGHVRLDRGVPTYLAARIGADRAAIFTIAFVEVRDGLVDPHDYADAWHARQIPFDALWFTPVEDPSDPCASMR